LEESAARVGGVVLGHEGYGRLDLSIGGQGFVKNLVMAQSAGSLPGRVPVY